MMELGLAPRCVWLQSRSPLSPLLSFQQSAPLCVCVEGRGLAFVSMCRRTLEGLRENMDLPVGLQCLCLLAPFSFHAGELMASLFLTHLMPFLLPSHLPVSEVCFLSIKKDKQTNKKHFFLQATNDFLFAQFISIWTLSQCFLNFFSSRSSHRT